jgi:ABC-type branched-subunit amino acid transport system ATPase component
VTVLHFGAIFASGTIDEIIGHQGVEEVYLGTADDRMMRLSVEGLRGGYGAEPVLLGVDISVAPGEIVAVIGRNGVGKSTLMRC